LAETETARSANKPYLNLAIELMVQKIFTYNSFTVTQTIRHQDIPFLD
jgi:hypothetical protein